MRMISIDTGRLFKHIKHFICLGNLLLPVSDRQEIHMDLAKWEVIYNKHKW